MLAVTVAPPATLTYEEFLNWADEDTRAEWVNGKVEWLSPVSRRHQKVGNFLARLLSYFVEAYHLGEVYQYKFNMKLVNVPSGREPDVLFVSSVNLWRVQANYLDGPADLVIEIVSPESVERDRVRKFAEYQQGGVKEYWLIDPLTETADFFRLDANGYYQSMTVQSGGRYLSEAIRGFWLRPEWLWLDPLSSLATVRKELGLT